MFLSTLTVPKIKDSISLLGLKSDGILSKSIVILAQISALIIPFYFAKKRMPDFEFGIIEVLVFIAWFLIAHLAYELFINIVFGIILKRSNSNKKTT